MTHAKLSELGSFLASRRRARELRTELLATIGRKLTRLTVDLEGVQGLSESFADEFFAVMVAQNGVDWFRERVQVVNANPSVRAALLSAIANRLEPSTNDQCVTDLTPAPATL